MTLPSVEELDALHHLRRRIEAELTRYAFTGEVCGSRLTVSREVAAIVRSNIERRNVYPDAVKTSAPGFVCSLAGVWILEAQG